MFDFVLSIAVSVAGMTGLQPLYPKEAPPIVFQTSEDCRQAAVVAVGMWKDGAAEAYCYRRDPKTGKLGEMIAYAARAE